MDLNDILEKKIDSFSKEKNDKIVEIINFLVDEFDKNQNQLNLLLSEIEVSTIEDDFFFMNIKKEDFKKRALVFEKKINSIEKRWSELVLVLNQRLNKK
jgi:2,3-bisphosphoglycerate-independent phosphoglycerate mutase